MTHTLNDTVALVTGANRGIGKAISLALLKTGARKLYAAVRDPESLMPLLEEFGDRVTPIRLDLSDPESIKVAAEKASDTSLLINNAGILHRESPLSAAAIAALTDEININVFGLIHMAQAFVPVLGKHKNGTLVQINSTASLRCRPEYTTYSASKAASYAITQGLRALLAEKGIRVISVHPGPIATDMAAITGLSNTAEPPSRVADSIIEALGSDQFHVFPDQYARRLGEQYHGFATRIVETAFVQ